MHVPVRGGAEPVRCSVGPMADGVTGARLEPCRLRPAVPEDAPAVLALWRDAAAPTSTDTDEALHVLMEHDRDALVVAEDAGAIVGTVVAGWDGWRGSVYRLAVAPTWRRRGLGTQLLHAAEARLARCGATRVHAIVVGTDDGAVSFWERTGWRHEQAQRRYTATLAPGSEGGAPGP